MILAWPSMRVTGSMTMRWPMACVPLAVLEAVLEVRGAAGHELGEHEVDEVGRGRAAGEEDVHRHHLVHRPHAVEQQRARCRARRAAAG